MCATCFILPIHLDQAVSSRGYTVGLFWEGVWLKSQQGHWSPVSPVKFQNNTRCQPFDLSPALHLTSYYLSDNKKEAS
jgi:hypothetical protein